MANYETAAVLDVVNECEPGIFKGIHPRDLAEWLEKAFRARTHTFITTHPALARLDLQRIKWLPLALVLSVGGDSKILDMVFDAEISLS
jgi:hypothetical protein